jgi:hypothetical protein
LLWAYHIQHPDITAVYLLGYSHQNRPILAFRITEDPMQIKPEPSVLVMGSLHGNELLSTEYSLDLLHYILQRYEFDNRVNGWVSGIDLWFVPMLNPDGNWTFLRRDKGWTKGRKNGRDSDGKCVFKSNEGVDISRNFPFFWGEGGKSSSDGHPRLPYYRGESPASEPETKALMRLAEHVRFNAALSFHTPGTSITVPYTHSKLKSPTPNIGVEIAHELIEDTKVQPNGTTFSVKTGRGKMAGTAVDWMFNAHGTLAFMIEGSHHNPEKIRTRMESIEGVRPISIGLLDRINNGPAVHGQILDKDESPKEVKLQWLDFNYYGQEEWTSRPIDGYFYQFVSEGSEVNIEITLEDSTVEEKKLLVGRKSIQVDWIIESSLEHQ